MAGTAPPSRPPAPARFARAPSRPKGPRRTARRRAERKASGGPPGRKGDASTRVARRGIRSWSLSRASAAVLTWSGRGRRREAAWLGAPCAAGMHGWWASRRLCLGLSVHRACVRGWTGEASGSVRRDVPSWPKADQAGCTTEIVPSAVEHLSAVWRLGRSAATPAPTGRVVVAPGTLNA